MEILERNAPLVDRTLVQQEFVILVSTASLEDRTSV